MTQEDKELLLKDLCARLPYNVKVEGYELPCRILDSELLYFIYTHQEFAIRRPYLRPMSSMTDEERKEYHKSCDDYFEVYFDSVNSIDWLNSHHFDYRGLIPKGLALEVTPDNNPYKV